MKTKFKIIKAAMWIMLCFFSIYPLNGQNLLWKANFTGSGNNVPIKSTIDSQNNIYVIGTFSDSCDLPVRIKTQGGNDVFIIKYDQNGNLLWARQIGGTSNESALGIVISYDDQFLYIIGTFQGTTYAGSLPPIISSGVEDGFLAKYKINGDIVWIKNIASASVSTIQRPSEIKIDKNGLLVIGGAFISEIKLGNSVTNITYTTSFAIGMFVAQFDTSGTILNAKKFEASNSPSQLYVVDVDTSGYYLCGYYRGNLITDKGSRTCKNDSADMFIYKVDYSLQSKWLLEVGGISDDFLYSCSSDNKGNFYIGGYFKSPSMTVDSFRNTPLDFNSSAILSKKTAYNKTIDRKTDVFFAKYRYDGVLQWFNFLGSKQNDYLYRALYKNGDFILAGRYGDTIKFNNQVIASKNTADAFAVVQDENNNLVYLIPIGGATGTDIGQTAVVDNKGNFVVIGDYTSSKIYFGTQDSLINSHATTRDMFVAKYDKGSISISKTDITCNGYANGSAIAYPMGALVYPLKYKWTKKNVPSFVDSVQTITALEPGAYYVQVTDAINYVLHDSVTFTDPPLLTVAIDSSKDVKCNGGSDGKIFITAAGGTLPYQYLWHTTNGSGLQASEQDQNALSQGTYYATVTDNKGCTAAISGKTLSQPDPISIDATIKPDTAGRSVGRIDITVTKGTPGALGYTYAWRKDSPVPFAVTQDIYNRPEGEYNVTVKDSFLCEKVAYFYLPSVDSIAFSYSTTDVSCNGGDNGTINLVVSGGASPYVYEWRRDGVIFHPVDSVHLTGLDSAVYKVTVWDKGGAGTSRSVNIIIKEPTVLSNTVVQTDIQCYGQNSGVIDLIVEGGTLPYTYSWTGPLSYTSTTEDISGLGTGLFNVTVTDAKGCTNMNSANITQPAALSVSAVTTVIDCYGEQNNGSIALNVSGGTGTCGYKWSNGPTTSTISLLPSGIYQCTVTDANNCSQVITQTLNLPLPITAYFTNKNVMCYGGSTGSATVNPLGGNGGFSYSWNSGATAQTASLLAPGSYRVTVTDIKNCTGSFNTSLTQIPTTGLSVSQPTTQNVNCITNPNGKISVSAAGNLSPYHFVLKLNGVATGFSGDSAVRYTFSGIAPANGYTVEVSDTNKCDTVSTAIINIMQLPSVLQFTGITTTDATCNGKNDGIILASASGGSGLRYFLRQNGIISNNASGNLSGSFVNLGPDNDYVIEVNDQNNCGPVTSQALTINEPTAITITKEMTQPSTSKNSGNGSITVLASGGASSYTYMLKLYGAQLRDSTDPGWETGKYENLSPADGYTIEVKDVNKCGPISSNILSVGDATDIPVITGDITRIYPNPARDILNIEFKQWQNDEITIELLSLGGQEIVHVKVSKNMLRDKRYTMDLSAQPRGMYLLRINNQLVRDKIVLQ